MGVSSAKAALKSFALILARTEARSGASREVTVSMARAPVAPGSAPASASMNTSANGRIDGPPFVAGLLTRGETANSRFHDGERISGAVFLDLSGTGEREMIAADHQLLGDDAIKQLAAGSFRHVDVLVVEAVPIRMRNDEGGHVGGVVGDHELARPGREMKRSVPGRMTG